MSHCEQCGATFGHHANCKQGQQEEAIANGIQIAARRMMTEHHEQQQSHAALLRENDQLKAEVESLKKELGR
ncbi:MAG TPA: hypothetical protein VMW24_19350 [Sedimentisphaerales bacterium]|nr:hypothetical protein [Sedimentisphaerales bacterium]